MTFSQSVKSEILKSVRNVKGCCATSFLTAVLKSVGSLTLGFNGYAFSVESDNVDFLKICQNLAFSELGVTAEVSSNLSSKGATTFTCVFDGSIGDKLGLISRDSDGAMIFGEVADLFPAKPCCLRAFLQGLFVACGSVVIPTGKLESVEQDKAKYHLELRFTDAAFASLVSSRYDVLSFRITPRKNHVILYLKDSEMIADFLVYVNAMSAKLELENVLVVRSIRNDTNRKNNCTYANIDKSIAAASKQLAAIATLRQMGVFDGLSDNLKEIALLRENYPEATLDEIADMLKISKSGANHRFAKIIELAKK